MPIRNQGGGGGSSGGSGDVTGPASSLDNEIARFSGTGGKTLQAGSSVTLDDNGIITPFRGNRERYEFQEPSQGVSVAQSGGIISNQDAESSVTVTLPTAPATNTDFIFYVAAAFNLVIDAPAGVTIRVGASATTTGGTVTSSSVGSMLHIYYVRDDLWVGLLSGSWAFA